MENTATTYIIGGSTGIGFAAAQRLVSQHRYVTLVGRSEAKLASAANALASPERVKTFEADLHNDQDVDRLIEHIRAEPGHIEGFVNSAGYFKPVSFLDHTLEDYPIPA